MCNFEMETVLEWSHVALGKAFWDILMNFDNPNLKDLSKL